MQKKYLSKDVSIFISGHVIRKRGEHILSDIRFPKWEKASENPMELLREFPDDFIVMVVVSEVLMTKKDYRNAISVLTQLTGIATRAYEKAEANKQSTVSVESGYLRGGYPIDSFKDLYKFEMESLSAAYLEVGNLELAEKNQLENLKLDDTDPDSWNLYGVILGKMMKYDDAENAYLQALNINPLWEYAWKNLAGLYRMLSRKEDASKIETFLNSRKSDTYAISLIVNLLYLKGEFRMVESLLERFSMRVAFTHDSLLALCNCYIYLERFSEVEEILIELSAKYPTVDPYTWHLSRVYALQNKREECLKTLGGFDQSHPLYDQAQSLKVAIENREDNCQTVKTFFQYYRRPTDSSFITNNQGLYLRSLTEIDVRTGTTIGDLIHILVRGEMERISPYIGIPSVHFATYPTNTGSMQLIQPSMAIYMESIPCMLQEIYGDNVASFDIEFYQSGITRKGRNAILTDLLFNGDILLLPKKPIRSLPTNVLTSSAFLLLPSVKEMIQEEEKGQTQWNLVQRKEGKDSVHINEDRETIGKKQTIDKFLEMIKTRSIIKV